MSRLTKLLTYHLNQFPGMSTCYVNFNSYQTMGSNLCVIIDAPLMCDECPWHSRRGLQEWFNTIYGEGHVPELKIS